MMKELAEGVFVETDYKGANVGAIFTGGGVICIDAPSLAIDARHWAAQVSRLDTRPIRFLILTDYNADRVINSRWLDAPILAHQSTAEWLRRHDRRYPQSMSEVLSYRVAAASGETVTAPVSQASLSFTDEAILATVPYKISVRHMPGPTPGSLWVQVPEAGVIFTGDSVVVDTHPWLSELCLKSWIESLQWLASNERDCRILVPGRGSVGDARSGEPILSYLLEAFDIVQEQVERGYDREEAAKHASAQLPQLPASGLSPDWVAQQVKLGLERVYEELKSEFDSGAVRQSRAGAA